MDFKDELPVNLQAAVTKMMMACGDTVYEYNPRQAARYTGYQCEELAEKLLALSNTMATNAPMLRDFAIMLDAHGKMWKAGGFDLCLERALASDDIRADVADADVDLAWVSIGALNSLAVDTTAVIGGVAAANLAKIGPDGLVYRDEQGKLAKPPGWAAPDHLPHLYPLPAPDMAPPAPRTSANKRVSGFAELGDE